MYTMKHMRRAFKHLRGYLSWKGVFILVAIAAVAWGTYAYLNAQKKTYTFATVKEGTIVEAVTVTGNTVPVGSVSLAFENTGMITSVNKKVGDIVASGDVLAQLDTSDLQTQLAQAQAAVTAAQAKLDGLKAGARQEDIQVSQAQLAKAQQDLANMYGNVPNTLADARTKANDAVRVQLAAFFSNADNNSAQVTFSSSNSQSVADLRAGRPAMGTMLDAWQDQLGDISAGTTTTIVDAALSRAVKNLTDVQNFLRVAVTAASNAITVPPGVASTDVLRAGANTATTETSTAVSAVNSLVQNIASQKILVSQLKAALDLKVAGASAQDIAAQQAVVNQAQANADSIKVRITKSTLTAPIAGVVTVQNAKVGQIASPNAPLVTIISEGNLEVDAYIPEADIGKITVGEKVNMTLDAFQGETFSGTIFFVDPAETIQNGVVDYKIKVGFDTPDPRIKSGLTANLSIQTKKKDNALILPLYAIIQNDQGAYVKELVDGVPAQKSVTLGIQDQSGNVEVVSGVDEDDQVLVVGLKTATQ
jgi:HlyD family secretion protein